MKYNVDKNDIFKKSVEGFCKINDIPPQKIKFEAIGNLMTIDIKNDLKDGVDFQSFNVLNFILQRISSSRIKFNQQLSLYPDLKRIDNITISFERNEYNSLNLKFKNGG